MKLNIKPLVDSKGMNRNQLSKELKIGYQAASDTPTAKARWVLIYIHFQIYSKAYETNEFL